MVSRGINGGRVQRLTWRAGAIGVLRHSLELWRAFDGAAEAEE